LLNFKNIIKDELPKNICDLVNKRFYITFHNLQSGKKEIKHTYKNVDELLDCIIRSCYVPFLIDYSPAYKNKYIDGVLPYFFKERTNRKVLYINVLTHDKYKHILNIKNETTNLHRVLSGMNDIHLFFIKNKNTQMCSYTDRWSIYEYFVYTLIRIIEISCFYTMCIIKDITCTETFNHIIKNVITNLFIKLSLI